MTFNTQNIQGCFEKVQLLDGGVIDYQTIPGIEIDMGHELSGEFITILQLEPTEEIDMTDDTIQDEGDEGDDIDENGSGSGPPKAKMTPKERDIKLAIHKFTQ